MFSVFDSYNNDIYDICTNKEFLSLFYFATDYKGRNSGDEDTDFFPLPKTHNFQKRFLKLLNMNKQMLNGE